MLAWISVCLVGSVVVDGRHRWRWTSQGANGVSGSEFMLHYYSLGKSKQLLYINCFLISRVLSSNVRFVSVPLVYHDDLFHPPFIYLLNTMQTLSTLQASLPLLFKFADLPPFHPNATHGAISSSSICCSLFLWFPRLMRFSGQTRLTLKIPSTGMIEVHFLWYISWPSLRYFLRFWFCMFSIQVPSFQSFHVSWVFTFVLLQNVP